MNKVTVGQRFERTMSMPFREKDGSKGTHTTVCLVEVTKVDRHNAEYRLVEVVSSTGEPKSFPAAVPNGGGFNLAAYYKGLCKGMREVQ